MSRKSVLITGCSSGIGYDAAHGMAARGWRVFATCRHQADCARLREEGLESFRLDYDDEASIQTAVDEALARTGGTLDALFNNGAFALPGAAEDLPTDALRAIFQTNFFGWHDLIRRIIPAMRAQGHGRIVNCSSVLGYSSIRWRAAYTATKHALEGYSDTLRLEMRDVGIKVILIEPGPVTSRIRENAVPHFERWIDWENSARSELYRSTLLERLYAPKYAPDRFELPASSVTQKLIHALESPNPRPRYRVTLPAKVAALGQRLLSTQMMDRITRRS